MKYFLFLTILLSIFPLSNTFNLSFNKNYNKKPIKYIHQLKQKPHYNNNDTKNKKFIEYLHQKQKQKQKQKI